MKVVHPRMPFLTVLALGDLISSCEKSANFGKKDCY